MKKIKHTLQNHCFWPNCPVHRPVPFSEFYSTSMEKGADKHTMSFESFEICGNIIFKTNLILCKNIIDVFVQFIVYKQYFPHLQLFFGSLYICLFVEISNF